MLKRSGLIRLTRLTAFLKLGLPALVLFFTLALPANAALTITQADVESALKNYVASRVLPEENTGVKPLVGVEVLHWPLGILVFQNLPEKMPFDQAFEPWEFKSTSLTPGFVGRTLVQIVVTPRASSKSASVFAHPASQTIGIPVEVSITQPVWVATNTIMPHQPLSLKDLKLETRTLHQFGQTPLSPDLSPSQFESNTMLRPGTILDSRWVSRIPDVRRLQEIRVVLKNSSGTQVSIIGTALEDGYIGQSIRVRQTQPRRKDYKATVTGLGRAQVSF